MLPECTSGGQPSRSLIGRDFVGSRVIGCCVRSSPPTRGPVKETRSCVPTLRIHRSSIALRVASHVNSRFIRVSGPISFAVEYQFALQIKSSKNMLAAARLLSRGCSGVTCDVTRRNHFSTILKNVSISKSQIVSRTFPTMAIAGRVDPALVISTSFAPLSPPRRHWKMIWLTFFSRLFTEISSVFRISSSESNRLLIKRSATHRSPSRRAIKRSLAFNQNVPLLLSYPRRQSRDFIVFRNEHFFQHFSPT